MNIEVRTALPAELSRVNEIRRMVNALHCAGRPDIFKPGFSAELRQGVYDLLEAGDGDVLVALVDGAVAGYAMVQYVHRPESPYNRAHSYYHVKEFGVDAAFRRRGVATAMVAAMRSEAKRLGLPRVELDAWAFNESAVAFYQSVGFPPYRWYFEMNAEDER